MRRWLERRPLVRLFLGRFFESELMPPGMAQVQVVIWTLALFAAPPYLLAMIFAFKYGGMPAALVPDAILADQLLFVTFSMMALGVVALVVWEAVFPDRRDVRVLGVLPISGRVQVLARGVALLLVATLYGVGVNLPGAVVFGITLWRVEVAADPVRGIAAHLVATAAAGLFTFFTLVVLQGTVMAVAGRDLARRLALLLQAAFVVVLLQALLFVPWLAGQVRAFFDGSGLAAIAVFPPAWFLALYDAVAGAPRAVPAAAVTAALVATPVAVLVAAALIAGSHRRLARLALESPPGTASPHAAAARRLMATTGPALATDSIERAVAGFVARTILRSRTHLTLLATCAGLAAALALGGLAPLLVRFGAAAFDLPRPAILSVPLAVSFVLLCGLRLLIALPTELRASWVFRVNAPADRLSSVVRGVRTAALGAIVLPIAVVSGLIGARLWGWQPGVLHGVFTATAGLCLLEVVLFGVRWLPFTRPYRMQTSSRMAWPLVLLAFSAYVYTLARFEADFLHRPGVILIAVLIGVAVAAGLDRIREAGLAGPPGLIFDSDDPDALFGGFGLSEGMAAAARRSPADAERIAEITPATSLPD